MKVFISADIEGVTGVTHWDETEKQKPDYAEFQAQMSAEVAAACEGALEAGADEIWVKDAHHTGRNLAAARLPREVRLVRGWAEHPFSMVQELTEGFDALLMVGYHAGAGSGGSPLAHTLTQKVAALEINGRPASELLLHAWAAALVGVPLAFVSGDERICADAAALVPGVRTVAVKRGVGGATVNIHPQLAVERIRDAAAEALRGDLGRLRPVLPPRFEVAVTFHDPARALRASFYPGAALSGPQSVAFEAEGFFEVLRMLLFTVL